MDTLVILLVQATVQTGHASRQGVGLVRREGASTGGWRTRPAADSFVAGGFP